MNLKLSFDTDIWKTSVKFDFYRYFSLDTDKPFNDIRIICLLKMSVIQLLLLGFLDVPKNTFLMSYNESLKSVLLWIRLNVKLYLMHVPFACALHPLLWRVQVLRHNRPHACFLQFFYFHSCGQTEHYSKLFMHIYASFYTTVEPDTLRHILSRHSWESEAALPRSPWTLFTKPKIWQKAKFPFNLSLHRRENQSKMQKPRICCGSLEQKRTYRRHSYCDLVRYLKLLLHPPKKVKQ